MNLNGQIQKSLYVSIKFKYNCLSLKFIPRVKNKSLFNKKHQKSYL